MKIAIGSRLVIYEGEVQMEHKVVEREPLLGHIITECDGERHEWHPDVLAWLAEPIE